MVRDLQTSQNGGSYSGSYRSQVHFKVDGEPASEELMEDILQVVVEESLHLPAMFTIVIRNDYAPGGASDSSWKYEDLMQIGKEIEIGFTSSTTETIDFSEEKEDSVLKGEVTAIETHFSERSQAPIILRGYDISHRLHRGQWNRSFQNVTDSDVVKKIAREAGISLGTVDNSGSAHDYLLQANQTNMEFLRERSARLGFELFVQNGKLNFRKPKKNETLTLKWLKDLHSFRVRVSSAEQVKEVEVRAWDYKAKKPIVSTVKGDRILTQTDNGAGSDTSTQFKGKPNQPTHRIVDRPVFSAKEADLMAQARFDDLGGQFVYADAKGEGNPEIRPGKAIALEGMGKHDGEYYVTATRQTFAEGAYFTEFSVRGSRRGDLLSTLSVAPQLQPGQTLLVGIVTNNQDPDGMGRVKVKFPSLTEEHESFWARMVAVGAGKDRGLDCLPEIDDEVLVAFEHGDVHRPYILGGVWNGQDAPPADVSDSVADGKVRLRTLKTRTGHQLQFVEEDKNGSKAGVYIETAGKHKLFISDSDKCLEIETAGGHKLSFNDTDGSITTTSTNTVTTTAPSSVSTTAASVSTTAGTSITSAAPSISLTGTSINLTGAVSIVGVPTITSPGIVPISAQGVMSIDALGALSLGSAGTVTIKSAGTVDIIASKINFVTPAPLTIMSPSGPKTVATLPL